MRALVVALLGLSLVLAVGCKGSSKVTTEGGGTLKLTQPSDVTIARGGTQTVDISITRDNVSGPVAISFSNLPTGVTVIDADKKIENGKATYTLKADPDAALVANQVADVTAKAPQGASVKETFKITVKEK